MGWMEYWRNGYASICGTRTSPQGIRSDLLGSLYCTIDRVLNSPPSCDIASERWNAFFLIRFLLLIVLDVIIWVLYIPWAVVRLYTTVGPQ